MYGNFQVLYADRDVVVAEKPFGMRADEGGMIAALRQYFTARGDASDIYPVHRLDRETGGAMVFARTAEAAAFLSAQLRADGFEKIYTADVAGCPEPQEGTLRDLLFHDRRRNKTYVTDRRRRGVKEAALSYAVTEARGAYARLRIRLQTGRTHQIRVQFSSRGHPLIGDRKYGGEKAPFLRLWAGELSFTAPDGQRLRFTLPAPFPALGAPDAAQNQHTINHKRDDT